MTAPLVLTAMAHPLRRRILDVLYLYGPATASALAARTDQGVGNISHHMRILSEAGLVEEAPELARDRRERWWRRPAGPISWRTPDTDEDVATDAVGRAASSLNLDRQVEFIRRWSAAPQEELAFWVEGPFSTDSWLLATPAELAQFAAEVTELIVRWTTREIPDDGAERRPVFTLARAVPATP